MIVVSFDQPFTFEEDTWVPRWYQRDGDMLRVKLWDDEPSWQASAVDRTFDGGRVGLSHSTSGTVNARAFVGVGTGGESAPRAPDGHVK